MLDLWKPMIIESNLDPVMTSKYFGNNEVIVGVMIYFNYEIVAR